MPRAFASVGPGVDRTALPCAQALLASLAPYRKDGGMLNIPGPPGPPVKLFRCTRCCYVLIHRDVDAGDSPELFSSERELPPYLSYVPNSSVRSRAGPHFVAWLCTRWPGSQWLYASLGCPASCTASSRTHTAFRISCRPA